MLVLGIPIVFKQISDGSDVGFVFAVAAILVFNLHHDNWPSVLYGQWGELFSHLLLEDLYTLHEERVLLA